MLEYQNLIYDTALALIPDENFYLFMAPTEHPLTHEKLDGGYYYDVIVEPKTHELTLEEIEKKLGYKIKIVTGKESL